MTNKIGVMQGRLLPKYKNQYQSHPIGFWEDEFLIAKNLGLDLIEFIVDLDCIEANPMMSESGLLRVEHIKKNTNVSVTSICADCFMAAPLHSSDLKIGEKSIEYLRQLIFHGSKIGITDIVIPCVDQSSLKSLNDINCFVRALNCTLSDAEYYNINLCLETDLNPIKFSRLLDYFSSPKVTVNYDTGNSASLGYDCKEELSAYGERISDIHIKDRIRGGNSIFLGEGNMNFSRFFEALKKFDYKGPFILQAYRDDEGISVFKKQLNWIKPYLSDYLGEAF